MFGRLKSGGKGSFMRTIGYRNESGERIEIHDSSQEATISLSNSFHFLCLILSTYLFQFQLRAIIGMKNQAWKSFLSRSSLSSSLISGQV